MNENSIAHIAHKDCTGCGLCVEKCPKRCISLQPDGEGFLFPAIDNSACISCGLCLKSCPVTEARAPLYHEGERAYFAVIAKDREMLLRSSSGGVFGMLAEKTLARGGLVCGCVYNERMAAEHILTDRAEDVRRMFGSKYVQSRVHHRFAEIKAALASEREVLFVGTACQIAALRTYLRRDYAGLLCAEILCHGVPSPALFATFVSHLEKKLGGRVLDVQFRNKEKDGWGSEHRTCVVYEKRGKIRKYRPTLPSYFSAFFYGLCLRESCYRCPFARPERVADLTLGDFWGYFKKYGTRFPEGISVIGVNTPRGAAALEDIRESCAHFDPLTAPEAVRSNDNFEHPIKRPPERDRFYRNLRGYRGLWKKAYLSRTYRRKTLSSFYGALVPARIRFALHGAKKRKPDPERKEK